VLEVHTELTEGTLHLRSNLPREVSACADVPGAPCDDQDGDGINDAWEDAVLSRMRPHVRLDEAEQLVDDPSFTTGVVGRVAPVGSNIHAYMMLGYQRDFGKCGGISAHNGDSERVALDLEPVDLGDARVVQAYTAAHENTISDHGMVFGGTELAALVHETDADHGEPRWVVFASVDKHASYGNAEICEGILPLPCQDEDCHAASVSNPTLYTLRMPYVNAGEPDAPLVTDLGPFGFDGEDAWAEQDFCGGLGGIGCAAPVRDKLVDDPFGS
jgi:hypothetical protein